MIWAVLGKSKSRMGRNKLQGTVVRQIAAMCMNLAAHDLAARTPEELLTSSSDKFSPGNGIPPLLLAKMRDQVDALQGIGCSTGGGPGSMSWFEFVFRRIGWGSASTTGGGDRITSFEALIWNSERIGQEGGLGAFGA